MDSASAFILILAVVTVSFSVISESNKWRLTLSAFLAGLAASVVSIILRSIPNYVNRTQLAFWSMIPVAVSFTVFLFFLLKKTAAVPQKKYADAAFSAAFFTYIASSMFYYVPLTASVQKAFVYYGESAVSSLVLFRVLGFTLALCVLALTFLAVYKSLAKLGALELRIAAAGSVAVLGVTQIIVIIQRLYSLKIIPKNRTLFRFIAFVVNNNRYFVLGEIAFVAAAAVILWKNNIKIVKPYANKAELRKLKAINKNARSWAQFLLVLLIVNALSLTVLRFYAGREVPLSPPENYTIADGAAVIPLEELEDDRLHRYEYKSQDGVNMRFIAIKKSEGSYGVCLDACDICGPSGYFERKGQVVCKLCDVVMNRGTIGFPGGCNPVPLVYIIHDGKIKIYLSDLEKESYRFK
ncbi:MAG: Fe-S-containing protein [Treponema sp.]